MRVFVAGATGVIGSPLLPALRAAGHEPIGMTRSERRAQAMREQGYEAVVCDAYDAERLRAVVDEASPQAIVHVLTDLPAEVNFRRFEKELESTGRLRREGTRNLLAAARAAGVSKLVAESISFIYAGPRAAGSRTRTHRSPRAGSRWRPARSPTSSARCATPGASCCATASSTARAPPSSPTDRGRRTCAGGGCRVVGEGRGMFSFCHVRTRRARPSAGAAGPRRARHLERGSTTTPRGSAVVARLRAGPRGRTEAVASAHVVGRWPAGPIAVWMVNELRGASNERIKRELDWVPRYGSWRKGFREAMG